MPDIRTALEAVKPKLKLESLNDLAFDDAPAPQTTPTPSTSKDDAPTKQWYVWDLVRRHPRCTTSDLTDFARLEGGPCDDMASRLSLLYGQHRVNRERVGGRRGSRWAYTVIDGQEPMRTAAQLNEYLAGTLRANAAIARQARTAQAQAKAKAKALAKARAKAKAKAKPPVSAVPPKAAPAAAPSVKALDPRAIVDGLTVTQARELYVYMRNLFAG